MATFEFLQNEELGNSYVNTIDFENLQAQQSFWDERVQLIVESPITTSRLLAEGQPIKLPLSLLQLFNCNYCRINQDGRVWYFFINEKNFINENSTALVLELDVMQTFMFDYSIKSSYIEREHQDRFDVNMNRVYSTTPEGLLAGNDYKVIARNSVYPNSQNELFAVSKIYFLSISAPQNYFKGNFHDLTPLRLRSGIDTLILPILYNGALNQKLFLKETGGVELYETFTIQSLYDFIGGRDGVLSINICPYAPISNVETDQNGNLILNLQPSVPMGYLSSDVSSNKYGCFSMPLNTTAWSIRQFDNPSNYSKSLSVDNAPDIDAESKLFTSPFYFYELSDNNNSPKQFKNEYCSNTLKFKHYTSFEGIIQDMTGIEGYLLTGSAEPKNYWFTRVNQLELPLNSTPWVNYYFRNKSQLMTTSTFNFIENVHQVVKGGTEFLAGDIRGNEGMMRGTYNNAKLLANLYAKDADLKRQPDTIRNLSNAVLFYLSRNLVYFEFRTLQITDEYRVKVFQFLQKFGYVCLENKVPNLKSRFYYNFIKMSANLQSNISNNYIDRIKGVYAQGTTIWHYRDDAHWLGVNNYSRENVEMALYSNK